MPPVGTVAIMRDLALEDFLSEPSPAGQATDREWWRRWQSGCRATPVTASLSEAEGCGSGDGGLDTAASSAGADAGSDSTDGVAAGSSSPCPAEPEPRMGPGRKGSSIMSMSESLIMNKWSELQILRRSISASFSDSTNSSDRSGPLRTEGDKLPAGTSEASSSSTVELTETSFNVVLAPEDPSAGSPPPLAVHVSATTCASSWLLLLLIVLLMFPSRLYFIRSSLGAVFLRYSMISRFVRLARHAGLRRGAVGSDGAALAPAHAPRGTCSSYLRHKCSTKCGSPCTSWHT
mmetsp:Transcript_55063/g.171013  ORF Transcript_55063/g.171013 Transcript_55063/m.171013 type:complete len:291 (-) Transcript_55063:805-1677(-)